MQAPATTLLRSPRFFLRPFKIGPYDYNIYSNSQIENVAEINDVPLKMVGGSYVSVGDVGSAQDANSIQTNIVRVDGQRSVYLPMMKQGGDTNTIAVVDAVKKVVSHLFDTPKQLVTNVVFDRSEFVKKAINTLIHEGAVGLLLTGLMVLLFLGSLRGTGAVLLSIPSRLSPPSLPCTLEAAPSTAWSWRDWRRAEPGPTEPDAGSDG